MSSDVNEISLFKNKVRGARRPLHLILDVRNQVSPKSYSGVITWIRSSYNYNNAIFNLAFPPSARHINETPLLYPTTAICEVRWAGSYLSAHVRNLSEFLQMSLKFQRGILLDDYHACNKILDDVENQFGCSLWLIKNKIALLQLSEGLEAQKKYTNSIREQLKGLRGVVSYIIYALSARCEPAMHPVRFIANEMERISSIDLPEDLADYLKFHIDPNNSLSINEIASILRWESASSIIDYYEALISVFQFAISINHEELMSSIIAVTRSLQIKLCDPRLDALLFELVGKETAPVHAQEMVIDAFNAFLTGEYDRSEMIASESLDQYPENHDLREIAASVKSLRSYDSKISERNLSRRLLSRMSSILVKQDSLGEDVDDLLKTALIFSGFSWAKSLLGFLAKELSPDPLEAANGVIHFAVCGTPSVGPLQFAAFPTQTKRYLYAKRTKEMFGECPAVFYGLAAANIQLENNVTTNWIEEERNLLSVRAALQNDGLNDAISLAEKLIQSTFIYYQQKGIGLKALCLLRLGRLEECIEFITLIYIQSPYLHVILPVREVIDVLDAGTKLQMEKSISLPIIYDMYCRVVDDSKSTERSYAYEDFLSANGLERPSQIVSILDKVDHDQAVHYLRYVCVEPVMDNSIVFQGTQDLRDERLTICRILFDLDFGNAEAYQTEIKDILRRSMIKKRMREVEQSKIYVDIESIRKTVSKTMRESYFRYISLLKAGGDTDASQYIHIVRQNVEGGDIEALIKFIMPQNDLTELLRSMVSDLRDQFVSSTEHGLDGYLSARIRHGTLQGQLRNPLEVVHLITQRDSATGLYKQNAYWTSALSSDEEDIKNRLEASFVRFSKEFDELVQEIKDEWIQISKGSEGKGLFNFAVRDALMSVIANYITAETSFEEFMDYVFNLLIEILQRNLDHIRFTLNETAKTRVSDLLTVLQSDIEEGSAHFDTSNLNSAITSARTGLQLAIDRIIGWFYLSDAVDNEPFHLEEVIGVAVESIRTPANGFDAIIHDPTEHPLLFRGRILAVFVDIFFIVFENIVRHSAASGSPKAMVYVEYGENTMTLLVENDIGVSASDDAARTRLREIEASMSHDQHKKAVSTEGGTGFLKIWKFLRHDFGITPTLNFGFRENQRFFVEFSLPFSLITLEG